MLVVCVNTCIGQSRAKALEEGAIRDTVAREAGGDGSISQSIVSSWTCVPGEPQALTSWSNGVIVGVPESRGEGCQEEAEGNAESGDITAASPTAAGRCGQRRSI